MIEIPVFQEFSADFTQIIILDNVRTTIRLNYNIRSEKWAMYLNTDNSEIKGLPFILNYPMTFRHKAIFPDLKGDFFLLRKTNVISDITYDNLGVDIGLYYLNETELEEWRRANGLD